MDVKVLMNIEDALARLGLELDLIEYSDCAEECRKSEKAYITAYELAYECASDTAKYCCDDVISSVNALGKVEIRPPKGSFLPGFVFPDELIEKVDRWNMDIEFELAEAIRSVSRYMTLGNTLETSIAKHAGYTCTKDPFAARNLYHAAAELWGKFVWGGSRLVIRTDENGNSPTPGTGIHSKMMEDIRKNPENYAIIEISYE